MFNYLQAIIIFILFLGPLIFFHELGHFLVARLFGVRVEVFSLGFGPKLLKFKKGFTEYAVSLIPLGGYVKMFGDDPLNKDGIREEDKKFSFVYQGKLARFWIIFGGPLANFLLAYFIFFSLMLIGERLPEIRFGMITEESHFYSYGIRSGDILRKINGKEVLSPSDIMLEGKNKIESITVERLTEIKVLPIQITAENFFNEFGQYSPVLRKPILVDKSGKLFALSLHEKEVNWKISLEAVAHNFKHYDFYIYPIEKFDENESKMILGPVFKILSVAWTSSQNFFEHLSNAGFKTIDLRIKNISMNSPADAAGFKAGDVLVSLNNEPLYSFEHLKLKLQTVENSTSTILTVWRNEQTITRPIKPEIVKADGKDSKRIGVESNMQILSVNYIFTKPSSVVDAFHRAFAKTVGSITAVTDGFKKLVTKEVSLKSVGGPIAIAQAATESFNTSLSYFFQIMALISVNLGVINLFPIPILDGGHLMFIFIEIFNRGPVSRRKLEIAQQFGLSFLLLLMVLALFNDFSRIF
ncbi:MAG: hypothetical protein A2381_17995 [Bdellovibrionales bacterium RIFOXYB1_FULL_37_110]|nr:MAG: hypothetical protein A2417_08785 [Bdellovibrionales bacterium RIFOXYC1_FULL_37_79]OFZ59862.1 MAG: hypothetical protein A2381_17995 [Bdellovibrionales bacterium RIFOXYB1_FULL_37_110]OFZ63041.1 MAG: hypothetical protein A2328_06370 [Bdellovibrionales bacterium RIFOXYB2_FULL_36_6]OFZ65476.1 MAG: hypothetical protein A2577_18530 [Bdellovibrionales bacterium RIFOXYD1_FULL_36_51]